jgi:glycosyltransferase involved in cell wall biosynthesis
MKRLGILTSHPIQYQAPWFRALAGRCELQVFFAHRQTAAGQGQAGFGVAFDWDVDLLSGYPHRFLNNVSPRPGADYYAGCDTPEIADIIAREQFDAFIVSGWYLKSYRQAMAACRASGTPVLVRGDSQLCTPRPWFKRLAMEFTQRRLLRQFDGFLTVGQRNREYLEHFGAAPDRIFFAPHFVDNDWFAARAAASRPGREATRKSWGAGESALVALFTGKFIGKKRPLDLVLAAAQVRDSGTEILPVFVGAGELTQAIRETAGRLKVPVYFAGFKNQSELPGCYAAADTLVLPSESETWGLVVNEAMACGLPAVVSDAVGCAPDLIDEGQTGYTFPMGDPERLAARLLALRGQLLAGHDFSGALHAKLETYSAAKAVEGVLEAAVRLGGQP